MLGEALDASTPLAWKTGSEAAHEAGGGPEAGGLSVALLDKRLQL